MIFSLSSSFPGFTEGNQTWLPVNENYWSLNVQNQIDSDQSSYKLYKSLVELRKKDEFYYGNLAYPVITETLFTFTR